LPGWSRGGYILYALLNQEAQLPSFRPDSRHTEAEPCLNLIA